MNEIIRDLIRRRDELQRELDVQKGISKNFKERLEASVVAETVMSRKIEVYAEAIQILEEQTE